MPLNRSLAAVLLAVFLSACAHLPAEYASPPDDNHRLELLARRRGVRSLRAEASLTLTAGAEAYPGSAVLVMASPARARADIFDPFGRLSGLVIIDDGWLWEYLPPEAAGNMTPEEVTTLARAAKGLSGQAEEVAALLVGLPGAFVEPARLAWSSSAGETSIDGAGLYLSRRGGALVMDRFVYHDGDDEDPFTIIWSGWKVEDKVPLPTKATLAFPRRQVTVEMTYKRIELNVELDNALFKIPETE